MGLSGRRNILPQTLSADRFGYVIVRLSKNRGQRDGVYVAYADGIGRNTGRSCRTYFHKSWKPLFSWPPEALC